MFDSMSKPARNGVSHVLPHCCAVDAMAVVPPTPKPSLGRRSIFPGHKDFAASFHLVRWGFQAASIHIKLEISWRKSLVPKWPNGYQIINAIKCIELRELVFFRVAKRFWTPGWEVGPGQTGQPVAAPGGVSGVLEPGSASRTPGATGLTPPAASPQKPVAGWRNCTQWSTLGRLCIRQCGWL